MADDEKEIIDESQKVIRLQRKWILYADDCVQGQGGVMNSNRFNEALKVLGEFDTVQGFWRVWSSVELHKLPPNSNLRMFKDGIFPSWEDPSNKLGGKFVITCTAADSPTQMWLLCLLALIGEQFDQAEQICGTVFSLRTSACNISLWNKRNDDKNELESIEKQLCKILPVPREKIRYQSHAKTLDVNTKSFSVKLRSGSVDASNGVGNSAGNSNNNNNNKSSSNSSSSGSSLRISGGSNSGSAGARTLGGSGVSGGVVSGGSVGSATSLKSGGRRHPLARTMPDPTITNSSDEGDTQNDFTSPFLLLVETEKQQQEKQKEDKQTDEKTKNNLLVPKTKMTRSFSSVESSKFFKPELKQQIKISENDEVEQEKQQQEGEEQQQQQEGQQQEGEDGQPYALPKAHHRLVGRRQPVDKSIHRRGSYSSSSPPPFLNTKNGNSNGSGSGISNAAGKSAKNSKILGVPLTSCVGLLVMVIVLVIVAYCYNNFILHSNNSNNIRKY